MNKLAEAFKESFTTRESCWTDEYYVLKFKFKTMAEMQAAHGTFLDALSEDQWQPIDTAPKDGTEILGYAHGDRATVCFEHGYWGLLVTGAHASDGEWRPTHWMPLPEPPKGGGQ